MEARLLTCFVSQPACVSLGELREAFQLIEEGHARVFRESLSQLIPKLALEKVVEWEDMRTFLC